MVRHALPRCPASKPRHCVPRLDNVGHTSGSVTEGRETASGQVQQYVPGFTEPTLVLRTKYRHGSASARCLTRHFPPAPFAAAFRCTDYADAPAHFDGRKVPRQAWIQAGTPGGNWLAPYGRGQFARVARKINGLVFCEGRFVFKSFFHCSPSPLNHQSPCHGLTQDTSPPLAAPSEDHFHAGGLEARLFANKATDG